MKKNQKATATAPAPATKGFREATKYSSIYRVYKDPENFLIEIVGKVVKAHVYQPPQGGQAVGNIRLEDLAEQRPPQFFWELQIWQEALTIFTGQQRDAHGTIVEKMQPIRRGDVIKATGPAFMEDTLRDTKTGQLVKLRTGEIVSKLTIRINYLSQIEVVNRFEPVLPIENPLANTDKRRQSAPLPF